MGPYSLCLTLPGEGLKIAATAAQTITIPYTFAVIDFSGATTPDLPTIDLGSIDFINLVGSIAVTMFSLLDEFSFLGIYVLILASLAVLWWLWSVVSGKSSTVTLNASGVVDTYANYQNQPLQQEIDMIESGIESGNYSESTGRLAGPTVALNKSLMASNRINSSNFRRAARLVRGSRRVKWW